MYQSKIIRDKERIAKTSEVFTPPELVTEMLDQIPIEFWSDPTKTILEPSVGNGQFIEGMFKRLMIGLESIIPNPIERHRHIFENQIFAVDLMPDNIQECIDRFGLHDIKHHFVCCDALTYDYSFKEWDDKEVAPESIFEWPS